MIYTISEALRLLLNEGWHIVVQRGLYCQLRHPITSGRVTVAGKESRAVSPMAWASICEQAGVK